MNSEVLFTLIDNYKQTNVWTMLPHGTDYPMVSGNKTYGSRIQQSLVFKKHFHIRLTMANKK